MITNLSTHTRDLILQTLLTKTHTILTQKIHALYKRYINSPPTTKNPRTTFLSLPRELRIQILLQSKGDMIIQRVHAKPDKYAYIALECTNHPAIDAWTAKLMRVSREERFREDIGYCRCVWYEGVQREVGKGIEWM